MNGARPAVERSSPPEASGSPVLEMRGIRKAFPGVVALDGVDLTLTAGEVHILLGENGAGKSTLMKILSGAYRRDAGEIRLRGREAAINGPADALALGIRVIYQELNLVPHLSAAENIFLGATPTRGVGFIDWRRLHEQARARLSDLGMAIEPSTPLSRLSLAERQMVEIAKALAPGRCGESASVLVMDEPTSALTAREVDQLFALIARLTARGVAIVYITHRLDEVYRIGQRVTVLRDGRHVSTQPLAGTTVAELVRLMANREIADHFPRRRRGRGSGLIHESAATPQNPGLGPTPSGPDSEGEGLSPLLRVEGIGRAGAVSDITFSLYPGEILGIAGLLGAGRSEVARILAGADRPDTGRILIEGQPVRFRTPADAIRRGIGLLPEDRKADGLVAGLTVARNIALPHARALARCGVLPRGAEARLAEPQIAGLRIKANATQAVRLLSGGNQQKVVLGKWLAGAARVFIFDEPTRGVDVGAKVEIYHLMNRLTEAGAGILMISSELPELLGMSDRILVMHRGRIRAEFLADEATQERVLSAALGLAS
jgi:ribose transport system ATP-binding protein